ncbi:cytochrome P450 [Amycolatopsis sp. OK19-0408]|uniref:Cytochrome P450 n=1 Tax=Amycolatopsis iheyensis TaxID=2945988 RepID=A0A9X2NHN1_9PSEU|nr:cytochrome P450 [Amycolatopsis iheyensis]MCR6486889.1 cytochrome P450 [Amycolatopsis iheyensis]
MVVRFDEEFLKDPVCSYARLRAEGPVHRAEAPDGSPVWLVTGYEDVRAGLADLRLSLDKAHSTTGYRGLSLPASLDRNLLNMDAPDHPRLRRILGRAFTPRRVEALRPAVEEIARSLADAVGGDDLLAEFCVPLPIRVICELLGVPPADVTAFREWTDAVLVPADPARARSAMGSLYAFLTSLVAAKRESPGDDLLSVVADSLTADEMLSAAFLLLLAGYENVVHVLGNGLAELLSAGLTSSTVDELVRHASPLQLAIRRFPVHDVETGGTTIPAGETVMLAVASAHRDASVFPDADVFDPSRAENPHVGFGFGPHYCLGAPLARLEVEVGLAALFSRHPGLSLAVPYAELEWRSAFRSRSLRRLPVRL